MAADFWTTLIAALLGSGVSTTVLGALFLRHTERVTAEVRSHRAYQEAALEQLFGPVMMQLGRTKRAFGRWRERDDHIEGVIVRESNRTIRDLLLSKGHLIPTDLLEAADALIEHFDVWLGEYEKVRVKQPDNEVKFVYVGGKGFPFPKQAENNFVEYAKKLQTELFGEVMND